jgi:hypothetical protein
MSVVACLWELRMSEDNTNAEVETTSRVDAALKAKSKNVDPLFHVNDLIDTSTYAIVSGGVILYLLSEVKKVAAVTREVTGVYGFVWNYLDVVGGVIAGVDGLKKAGKAKRNKTKKRVIAALDIVGSTQLAAGTTITALGAYSHLLAATVLTANSAAAFGPFAFSVGMMLATIKESVSLHDAIKKTDMMYLLNDRWIKYEKLSKKDDRTPEEDEKLMILANQVYALSKEEDTKKNDTYPEYTVDRNHVSIKDKETKDLVNFLKRKQEAKVKRHVIGVVSCSLATAGMTLIAASLFFPPLMIPGIVVAAVSGAIKLVESILKRARGSAIKTQHQSLLDEFKESLRDVPVKYKKIQTRKKMRIAYDNLPKAGRPTQQEFYETIGKLPWYAHQRFLDQQFKRYVNERLLEKCPEYAKTSVSDKDKESFIEDFCCSEQSKNEDKFHRSIDATLAQYGVMP